MCAVRVMQPTAAPESCPQCHLACSAFRHSLCSEVPLSTGRWEVQGHSRPARPGLWMECWGNRSSGGGRGFWGVFPVQGAAPSR